jgi:hypothetical protein
MFGKEDKMKNLFLIICAAALCACSKNPDVFEILGTDNETETKNMETEIRDTNDDSSCDSERDSGILDSDGSSEIETDGNNTEEDTLSDTGTDNDGSTGVVDTESETETSVDASDMDTDTDTDNEIDSTTNTEMEFDIPSFVCDPLTGCGDESCAVGDFWICPLLPEASVIATLTYKTQWLICEEIDGDQVCPTNGYHRPCQFVSQSIGLTCND